MTATGMELTFAQFGWESKRADWMVARKINSVEWKYLEFRLPISV